MVEVKEGKTLGFSGTSGSTVSQTLKGRGKSELKAGGQGIHKGPGTGKRAITKQIHKYPDVLAEGRTEVCPRISMGSWLNKLWHIHTTKCSYRMNEAALYVLMYIIYC